MWMATIFVFSTSDFGSEQTGAIFEPLVRFFYPSIPQATLDVLHFVIRKLAHLTEYAILAYLWYRALSAPGTKSPSPFMTSLLICVLYAISDEWHQSFIADRGPSPADSLLDSCGAAIMLLLLGIQKAKIKTRELD